MSDNDRTVHARWAQMEVVRYEKAGKWYLEPVGSDSILSRQRVDVRTAAEYAVWALYNRQGHFYLDQPGGSRFDFLVDQTHLNSLKQEMF